MGFGVRGLGLTLRFISSCPMWSRPWRALQEGGELLGSTCTHTHRDREGA